MPDIAGSDNEALSDSLHLLAVMDAWIQDAVQDGDRVWRRYLDEQTAMRASLDCRRRVVGALSER